MKNYICVFVLLFVAGAAFGQFPASPNKIRLGNQTTGDGLLFRTAGVPSYTPTGVNNAWTALDTVTGTVYYYQGGAWNSFSPGTAIDSMIYAADTLYLYTPDTVFKARIVSSAGPDSLSYTATTQALSIVGSNTVSLLMNTDATLLGSNTNAQRLRVDTSIIASKTWTVNQGYATVVDSTRLRANKDSVLVYYQNGTELRRDTIRVPGGGGGGTLTGSGTTNTIPLWTGATALGDSPLTVASGSVTATGTGFFRLPNGTTAQRPASPLAGMTRWNTTNGNLDMYGLAWENPVKSATATGLGTAGRVFYADANGRAAADDLLYWDATNNRLSLGDGNGTNYQVRIRGTNIDGLLGGYYFVRWVQDTIAGGLEATSVNSGNFFARLNLFTKTGYNQSTKTGLTVHPTGIGVYNWLSTSPADPVYPLDIVATSAMRIPVGTTAQRPGTLNAGIVRYNSSTGFFEGYTTEWNNFMQTTDTITITGNPGAALILNTNQTNNSDIILQATSVVDGQTSQIGRLLFNRTSAHQAAGIIGTSSSAGFFANLNYFSVPFGRTDTTGMMLIGNTGFNFYKDSSVPTTAPRLLTVTGEARITDLTTDTPTRIVGADADGDLAQIRVGSEIGIKTGDTLTINQQGATTGQALAWNGSNWRPATISASVADGDKGDITVSGSGATWTIDNNAVTTAKINDAAVTEAKLANGAAGGAKIGAVTYIPLDSVDADLTNYLSVNWLSIYSELHVYMYTGAGATANQRLTFPAASSTYAGKRVWVVFDDADGADTAFPQLYEASGTLRRYAGGTSGFSDGTTYTAVNSESSNAVMVVCMQHPRTLAYRWVVYDGIRTGY